MKSKVNYIGYHLQQAVELCLKYQLEKYGVNYPKVHDIDQLIRFSHQNNVNLIMTDYISEHSEMFSLWEARARYVLDYYLESEKTEKALVEVSSFLFVTLFARSHGLLYPFMRLFALLYAAPSPGSGSAAPRPDAE